MKSTDLRKAKLPHPVNACISVIAFCFWSTYVGSRNQDIYVSGNQRNTSKMQHTGENACVNEMCIQKVRFWMWEDMLEVTLRPLSS